MEVVPDPLDVQSWCDRAYMLADSGETDAAVAELVRLVELHPETLQLRCTLADLCRSVGDHADALAHHEFVLDREPDHAHCRRGLSECLSRRRRLVLQLKSDAHVRALLTDPDVNPDSIMRAIAVLARSTPDPLAYPLLLEALSQGIVTDPQTERLLTRARREICLGTQADHPSDLAIAIADQCVLNEFAWPESTEEREQLSAAPSWVRAMYAPVTHPTSSVAAGSHDLSGPSAAVKEQYEENPYPRWTRITRWPNSTLAAHLRVVAGPRWSPPGSLAQPSMLVAGCGTARELISAALAWNPESVTGIDLSAASLGVARQRAAEYELTVDLVQADLQTLDWQRGYDVIICTGVLHHLDDMMSGWRVLRGMLAPGGVMWIGLYSHTARTGITRAQELVRSLGLRPTPDGVRSARAFILALANGDAARDCLLLEDFYSLSGCRDLLFHPQERHVTLAEIEGALTALDLHFLGFEVDGATRRGQHDLNEADSSLAAWSEFEMANPRTFLGMYQFWCQAPDS